MEVRPAYGWQSKAPMTCGKPRRNSKPHRCTFSLRRWLPDSFLPQPNLRLITAGEKPEPSPTGRGSYLKRHLEGVRMKYTGRLSKPITRKHIGQLAGEAAYQAEAQRTTDEMFSKLPDLFEAHGVSENNCFALVLAMAKEHVPGFKMVNPAGRKVEWSAVDKAEFKLDVDTFINQSNGKKRPITDAIAATKRLETWTEKTKGMKITALAQHYYTADRLWIKVVADARKYKLIVGKD